jgi:hypothetical protein
MVSSASESTGERWGKKGRTELSNAGVVLEGRAPEARDTLLLVLPLGNILDDRLEILSLLSLHVPFRQSANTQINSCLACFDAKEGRGRA